MKPNFEDIRNLIITIFIAVLVLVLSFVCITGLWRSFSAFTESRESFSKAYSDAAAAITKYSEGTTFIINGEENELIILSPEQIETIRISIDHLERLQTIQQNAVTNDMMSFLYSTLTTLLIGLCVGFVVKTRKYADEARDSAKKASDDSVQMKTEASAIAEIVEKATKKQTELDEAYEKQKTKTEILGIHIGIVHFRAALISGERIVANDRIYNVFNGVLTLPDKADKKEISYMRQELLKLYTPIENYKNESGINAEETDSRTEAAELYKKWIKEAVNRCGIILGT